MGQDEQPNLEDGLLGLDRVGKELSSSLYDGLLGLDWVGKELSLFWVYGCVLTLTVDVESFKSKN